MWAWWRRSALDGSNEPVLPGVGPARNAGDHPVQFDRESTSAGDDGVSRKSVFWLPADALVGDLLDLLVAEADLPGRGADIPWTWIVSARVGSLAVLDVSRAQRVIPLVDRAAPLAQTMGDEDWRVFALYMTQRDPAVVAEEELARARGELSGPRERYRRSNREG